MRAKERVRERERERERRRESTRDRERDRDEERESDRDRGRDRQRARERSLRWEQREGTVMPGCANDGVCVRERERVYVCVCMCVSVCDREREREREDLVVGAAARHGHAGVRERRLPRAPCSEESSNLKIIDCCKADIQGS